MLPVHICKTCSLSSEDGNYIRRHEFSHLGENDELVPAERKKNLYKNKALRKVIVH